MNNIIVFAGSNSKTSINKQLAIYAASLVENAESKILDLNDFELPIFSIEYENEHGIPDNAHQFLEAIKASKGIVLSLAEHNGAYAAVFKNLIDWMSRIDGKVWQNKPMLLMATSPGGRGGQTVLEIAEAKFSRWGTTSVNTFSLPSFGDNFSDGKIVNEALNITLIEQVKLFEQAL